MSSNLHTDNMDLFRALKEVRRAVSKTHEWPLEPNIHGNRLVDGSTVMYPDDVHSMVRGGGELTK